MTEQSLAVAEPKPLADFPGRSLAAGANVGAVAIEQERAIAETQGQLILAKRFPRSMASATAEMMEACKSPEFAQSAFYSVPNRGSGPSIRFAEEVARCYGNFQYGHRELSRSGDKSEVEVYAWDMERNNRSTRQITVMHYRDKRDAAPVLLKDQTDIDNRIANVASKQIRGRILALMPKGLVAQAIAACKLTLAGGNDVPITKVVNDMVAAFGKFGVTVAHLEKHLDHKLDAVTVDEIADLRGIFNALQDGGKPSEYFSLGGEPDAGGEPAADGPAERIAAAAKKKGEGKKGEGEKKQEPAKPNEPAPPAAEEQKPQEPAPAAETAQEAETPPEPASPAEDTTKAPEPAHTAQEPAPQAEAAPAATAQAAEPAAAPAEAPASDAAPRRESMF